MAALMPQGKQQYFTAGGIPLVGGKVYTYAAGTTTPLATYTTAAAGTPNANPVILDSRGEASIFFSAANYKIVVKDSLDSTIWTQDNLPGDQAATILANLAASTGSSLVGHIASGAGGVATTVQAELRQTISVFAFMSVAERASVLSWGSTDVTTAVQAAVDHWIAEGLSGHTVCLKFPHGKYVWSMITIDSPAYTLSIQFDGCEIVGNASTAKNGVIDLIDANVFNVTGSHVINGSNSANYLAGWCIRSNTSGGLARVNIYNPTIRNIQVGMGIFGNSSGLKASEINVFGANFVAVPIPVQLTGSESGAQFQGCNIVSERNAAFPGSPERAIWMLGGFIKVVGGSIVANPTANQTFYLNPSSDSAAHNYPTLICSGVHIESNSGVLCNIGNPSAVSAPISNNSCLIITACTGYSGGGGAIGDFVSNNDATYAGLIAIKGNNFYAGAARASFNVSTNSTSTRIDVDEDSFGINFYTWPLGISGGTDRSAIAQYNSYTATATGMTTSPTGTVEYVRTGRQVVMKIPNIYGTSNATTFTLTGGTLAMRPTAQRIAWINVIDNGTATVLGLAIIATSGVISLYRNLDVAAFTAAGVKGVGEGTLTYVI